MLLCGYEMMQSELAIYHILHHHRAAFRNVNVIFKGLERLESAGAFPPLSENGMPLSGARRCAWSRWDWPPSHLPGHHLPTLNKGSFAKAQHPLAAGLIPTPGPAAPGRKAGDRSTAPASCDCHQCKKHGDSQIHQVGFDCHHACGLSTAPLAMRPAPVENTD